MSVCQLDSEFTIKANNLPAALAAICPDLQEHPQTTFARAMHTRGWQVEPDCNGDISGIQFNGDYWKDDTYKALILLAPFVEPNSYIELFEGALYSFRYVFENGKLYEQAPIMSWDSGPKFLRE